MNFKRRNKYSELLLALRLVTILICSSCQKTTTAPNVSGVASLTIVNAIPNSNPIIPVINTSQPIIYFNSAISLLYGGNGYGFFYEYSPLAGKDTLCVVQNTDTLDVGPKTTGQLFYDILPFQKGEIYSLFLCGADTTLPDFLLTTDSLPYYPPGDSVMGIRFVNLSTNSNSISINLEGSQNGSEVSNLVYKGITGFKTYVNNSSTADYMFVVRDAASGDSLTQFDFLNSGSGNYGFGLIDPYNGTLLTFRNITIALIGQPGANASVPQSTILIDNY